MKSVRTISMAVGLAGMTLGCGSARGQLVDTRIPLNYNFHGMAHSAALNGGTDEYTTVANNGNGDLPNGYRSIADRGFLFDPTNNHSIGFYTGQNIGRTGLSYAFFDTLGYGNTTQMGAAGYGLDIVHLGSRCAGFTPAVIFPYETVANTATTVGIAPAWSVCDHTNAVPQTTSFAPIALDGGAEIGVLFNISSGGGQFDVVLGFSDHANITVRVAAPDWFGIPADAAILANMPVSSQGKVSHTVSGTAYASFQGCSNNDAPVNNAFLTSGAGPNLNAIEAVISVPMIKNGVGTFTADPTIVGAHLNSLTFQNALYPAAGGRGNEIMAATVRTGQPSNANCATPTVAAMGDNAGNNVHTFGATPTSCGGGNDVSAVYYQYTAVSTGMIEARTCGSAIDTTLAVYSTCGGAELACNDDACGSGSVMDWAATGGQSYIIRVSGKNGVSGNFTLHIDDPAHVDVPIALNYNFHGMAHAAALNGGTDEFTTVANNANADGAGMRGIADRSFNFDPTNVHSIAYYSGTKIGAGGLSYAFYNTLGWGNSTDPNAVGSAFDMIHLGTRCAGFTATNNAYETAVNAATAIGIAPPWGTCDQTTPQMTSFAAKQLSATSQIGVLYHASNQGGTFDVVLGFSDHASITVTLSAPDWFGIPADPAIVANMPVSSQKKLAHPEGTTLYTSFQACNNNDAPVITTFLTTGAGPNLNLMEGVISVPLIISGIGTFPADPTIVGAHLNSVTFQNASFTIGRGYGIFAMTVRDAVVPPSGVCCRGATCSTSVTSAGDCSASVAGALAGAAFPSGTCNAGGSTTSPCCYPDYNKTGGITVGDIFDFLNDWFAGKKFAILGGDGVHGTLNVQNIFDFLNAWFAGGC
jgi:hypothetical protein